MTVVTVAIYSARKSVHARETSLQGVKSACREHEIRTGREIGEAYVFVRPGFH